MTWYKDWFDENYVKLYQHRDEKDAKKQVDLILAKVPAQKDWSILDLACGSGRHCQLFFEAGYLPIGVDLSNHLIGLGMKQYPHLDLKVGDMQKISGKYNLILSLFTSFGYFEDSLNNSFLKRIFQCLKKNGFFWLDFLNTAYLRNNLVPYSKQTIEGLGEVSISREIKDKRVNKKIIIEKEKETKIYRESVALYNKEELVEMIKEIGFNILGAWGDYDGHIYSQQSSRTILLCQTP